MCVTIQQNLCNSFYFESRFSMQNRKEWYSNFKHGEPEGLALMTCVTLDIRQAGSPLHQCRGAPEKADREAFDGYNTRL